MTAALQDGAAVDRIVAGSQAIVHLGGVSTEGPFAPILEANIVGVWNLYEAARRHGVKRDRLRELEPRHRLLSPGRGDRARRDPMRPDGHYGLSKAFGENVARFYFDRYGIESVCLRIGSSFPEPKDRRMLATWLSYDDLERLVVASLTAPVVGCSVVYGVSDNTTTWWDNTSASHLGFRPQDSSRAVSRRRRGAPAGARPERSGDDLPGRRVRQAGAVRALAPARGQSFISRGSTRLIHGNATSIASSTTSAKTNGVTPRKIVAVDDARQHALDDEHVHADRRADQADLDDDDDDDAEPDRVEAEADDEREEHRHREQDHRQLFHRRAEDDVDDADRDHHRHRMDLVVA